MELLLLGLAGLGGLALLLQQKPLPSKEDAEKAFAVLDKDPTDPDANTVFGKYRAFVIGDYEGAMPYLVHSKDTTLKALAEHELNDSYTKSAPQKVGMGDEWVTAAKKFPALGKIFYDRAVQWYGLAWPDLKKEPLWGDKLRERLRKLYLINPNAALPKNLTCPSGWKCPIADTKAARFQGAARSGQSSFAIVGWKSPLPAYGATEQAIDVKPGTYKVSGWVVADGTDQTDSFLVNVQNANGTNLILRPVLIMPDLPWWRRVETEIEVPKDGIRMGISVVVGSKQGMIYVDDVSIKGPDGKELLKNGSFEDR